MNKRENFSFFRQMNPKTGLLLALLVISLLGVAFRPENPGKTGKTKAFKLPPPDADNGGIKLASGFGAVTVVDSLGKARHLFVSSNGDIYVRLSKLKDGKGVMMLRDTDGNGKADVIKGFGNFKGTGITIYKDYLYASSDTSVSRFPMKNGVVEENAKPETIVTGLPNQRQHEAKPITIDDQGKLYVTIGAPSNACQEQDRTKGSKGQDPCPILELHGGIWQFDATKLNQTQKEGVRYATGIRNAVALEWNPAAKQLYALQHGRDQLVTLYPELYTNEQSAELPAEEFLLVKKGSDFGWPYCYYDEFQNKKVLAPEYGGDGGKAVGRCAGKDQPIMAFPGHWAPNDLVFYTGNQFPARYKNGAFVAFHGSWNRAPLKQAGYFVAFIPMKDGKPSGKYEVFAEQFAGGSDIMSPDDALYRPMGLAQGPDGSLYISDDVKGKIWRVMYTAKKQG